MSLQIKKKRNLLFQIKNAIKIVKHNILVGVKKKQEFNQKNIYLNLRITKKQNTQEKQDFNMGTSVSHTGHLQRLQMRRVQQQMNKARRQQQNTLKQFIPSNIYVEEQQSQKNEFIRKDPQIRQYQKGAVDNDMENKTPVIVIQRKSTITKDNSPIRLQPIRKEKQILLPPIVNSNSPKKSINSSPMIIKTDKNNNNNNSTTIIANQSNKIYSQKIIDKKEQDLVLNQQEQLMIKDEQATTPFYYADSVQEEELHVNIDWIRHALPPPKTKNSIMRDKRSVMAVKLKEHKIDM